MLVRSMFNVRPTSGSMLFFLFCQKRKNKSRDLLVGPGLGLIIRERVIALAVFVALRLSCDIGYL